uniref:Uncharacterized protein n=1 Tax=Arundo donax TaxID=35708 RepID=A0A0A9A6B1_ARUDO
MDAGADKAGGEVEQAVDVALQGEREHKYVRRCHVRRRELCLRWILTHHLQLSSYLALKCFKL